MKRRNFLHIFPSLGVAPLALNGFSLRPFANRNMAKVLANCEEVEGRTLVLIQLKGGNDGLNAVIPLPQYATYASLRPTIKVGETALVNLDNTLPDRNKVGLHPALTPFKNMYDQGMMNLVQGVGYENMNQSHFKGTDLWLTGGDSTSANFNIGSGWMGRSLQGMYPDVLGAPTTNMPDPLGIQVGDPNPSLGFHTETEHQNVINLSGQDVSGFYSLVQTIGGAPIKNVPQSEHGEELEFIMNVERSLNAYAKRISDVFNAGTNSAVTYPDNAFANQLKTVARLIRGGSKTKVFLCQLGGFDTHSGQVEINNTSIGEHAELLNTLANGVKAFFDDLEAMGISDQVMGCTFSEFGRCARENGSFGTDHGTLEPVFVFGKHAKAGVSGTNVNLGDLTPDNQLKGVQFDYRSVFTTLLQDWLGASDYVLEQTMFDGFTKVPLIDTVAIADPSCYIGGPVTSALEPGSSIRAITLFPNPANIVAEVAYESQSAFDAYLTLHSLGGRLVSGQHVRVAPGSNFYDVEVFGLPPGTYFVRLENKRTGGADVAKLQVVK